MYCKIVCELTWLYIPESPERMMFYLACQHCRKKVHDVGNSYRCDTCDKSSEDAVPTYNFRVMISDCSASTHI